MNINDDLFCERCGCAIYSDFDLGDIQEECFYDRLCDEERIIEHILCVGCVEEIEDNHMGTYETLEHP